MKLIRTYILPVLLLLLTSYCYAQPNANFTANITSGCTPLLVQFTSHSSVQSGHTHSWDMAGTPSTKPNPSRVFTNPGTYTIKHTVTGSNGTKTETKTNFITVYASPSVDFTGAPLIGCPPLTVNFTDKSTLGTPGAGSYKWTFINAPTSTAKNPTNTYTYGPLDVSLTVTNSKGCSKTLTKTKYVDVYSTPSVSFTANKTDFCYNAGTVNFTATASGSGNTFAWDFGDGVGTSTSQNPTYTYSGVGPIQYTVKLTVTDPNGCKTVVEKINYIKVHKPEAKFSAPLKACVGTTVTFTNQSPPVPNAQDWNFGDGTASVFTPNAFHKYYTPGTYNVRLIVYYGTCPDTIIKPIIITPQPNIDFYKTPDTLCPAPQTVEFATYDTSLVAFRWDFGNPIGVGNTSLLKRPTHTYGSNGIYNVTLIATDTNGCKDTLTKQSFVKIYPLYLRALPRNGEGCIPLTISFNSLLLRDTLPPTAYPYPAAKYKWEFDNGDTSNLRSPIYTYTDTGVYTVKLTVTTVQGCIVQDSIVITAGDTPTANFVGVPTTICNRQKVKFTNLSTGYSPLTSTWNFGAAGGTSIWSPNFKFNWPGVYPARLIVSHYGCRDTMLKLNYIHVKEPGARFNVKKDCSNSLKVITENTSIGDSVRTWHWGDGNTDTAYQPTHTYATAGLYNIMLVVHKPSTGCYDTVREEIYAGPNPPEVIADRTTICAGDTIYFSAYKTHDTSWAQFKFYVNNVFGLDTLDSIGRYMHVFHTAGLHEIKVVAIQDSCTDSVVKSNWIFVSKPKAAFAADTAFGCSPFTFNFTDTSSAVPSGTIVSRRWNFGRGFSDTLITTKDTNSQYYDVVGDYSISLTVTDALGCKDTVVCATDYIHAQKPDSPIWC